MGASELATPNTVTDQKPLWDVEWSWRSGPDAAKDSALIQACVALYSSHYGTWGPRGKRPGEPVQMTPERLVELLSDQSARLACAFSDGELVGYCVALRSEMPGKGLLSWVTQLVVHRAYRNARIATRLLYGMWHFSNTYAAGIATANPFAIRALETATRRRCSTAMIRAHGEEVLAHLARHGTYLPTELVRDEKGTTQPRVDTQFFLDHNNVERMRKEAARDDRPWALGGLDEGEEWFGCTFNQQAPHAIDDHRLNELLTGDDAIWILAYEGMTLTEDHVWHGHAPAEVSHIVELTQLAPPARVLDVGCGDGRHVREFSRRGFVGTGVDIVPRLIARAEAENSNGTQFVLADARHGLPEEAFDLVTCLYDVIGSSANPDDDLVMVQNMARALRPGGYLVATVMNTAVTFERLQTEQRPANNQELVAALEKLPPSRTMETSGNVFDPELLIYYRDLYYRKEQFEEATWRLPVELVVRDRRFSGREIEELVRRCKLEVLLVKPVQAGQWDRSPTLEDSDPRAKEFLVLARRPV